MKKKIGIIISICLLLTVGVIVVKKILVKNYEMPAMPFIYDNKHNDHYIFARTGQVYVIYSSSGKRNAKEWVTETINLINTGGAADWLQPVGKVAQDDLQHYYNLFREIRNNPDFEIYPTENAVPDVYPNTYYTQPWEYWHGSVTDDDIRYLFYQGYLHYKSTDERVYEIVDWINEQVERYKLK